jgi:hypothetical protein
LEWIPGKFNLDGKMPVRLVGVYDGERYRAYHTVSEFLTNELTSKNRGKWFYAHAGGLADFQFLLHELLSRKGYKINASFSGSSAIIVHVTQGKNSWHFIDSFWLLKAKLRDIGKWIGISKGNEDESEEFYRDAPWGLLRDYNEVDCVILYKAIQQFELTLLEMGGQLKMTQASCAMDLFRRRFLKTNIDTDDRINVIARGAYFASRVEVINKRCDDAFYYDVNSSFPYAMTFPIPGDPIGTFRGRMPDYGIYIADVDIYVPECLLPPLPTRMGGRLFFPVGRWRGWFSNIDIELLQKVGGKVEKVYQSIAFEPRTDCKEYAETLYSLRAKSTGFMQIACKFLLNSLYGKFAESDIKSSLIVNPDVPNRAEWKELFPGAFIAEKQVPIPHMHVPISVHITAIARRTLYECMGHSQETHYCDTDGFSSVNEFDSIEGQLGSLKLEKIIRKGRFILAKTYDMDGTDAKGKELRSYPDQGVKAKGFSRMNLEKFEKLIGGIEIEYSRMARIKEILRGAVKAGSTEPLEKIYRKKLRPDSIPKRFFYPDDYSRPWSIEELMDIFQGR